MKGNRLGIKWKIFLYMLSFATVLIVLLWFVQTVYLETFYKKIKTNEVEDAFESLSGVIEESDMSDAVDYIASSYDICVVITDIYGNEIYSSEQNMQCAIHKLRNDEIKLLVMRAKLNGGSYSFKKEDDMANMHMPDMGKNQAFIQEQFHGMEKNSVIESIIRVDMVEKADGTVLGIIVDSVITPVDATVHTLRIQLIYISIIMVLLALVIAFVLSWHISKPIIRINDKAKELGKGDYTVHFDTDAYKEISQLSDTLNQTVKELAKAEGLQRELVANVSHDLRTPLTMIKAYSEIMRDIPCENTPENVQVIIDEADRLTNLVNDLLDVSKLQAGVTALEMKEYNLTDSIKSVLQRLEKFLEKNGYHIDFQYDRSVLVNADEYKICQVLYNLVSNGINYTGADKTVVVRQKVNGSIVRIEVSDSGEGIEPNEIENVWERYYKVDKEHKRAAVGSGLGLSIVKNILKLHNYQYGVNSVCGEGTTFWFEMKILLK